MAYPAQTGRTSSIEMGTKLYISNLDYGIKSILVRLEKIPIFEKRAKSSFRSKSGIFIDLG